MNTNIYVTCKVQYKYLFLNYLCELTWKREKRHCLTVKDMECWRRRRNIPDFVKPEYSWKAIPKVSVRSNVGLLGGIQNKRLQYICLLLPPKFVMPACNSQRNAQQISRKLISESYVEVVDTFQFLLEAANNNGCFAWRPTFICPSVHLEHNSINIFLIKTRFK